MAAGILPEPGSEYGPCKADCIHKDCAETRQTAVAACVHCGDPIGYGVRFYRVSPARDYAHASCEENVPRGPTR